MLASSSCSTCILVLIYSASTYQFYSYIPFAECTTLASDLIHHFVMLSTLSSCFSIELNFILWFPTFSMNKASAVRNVYGNFLLEFLSKQMYERLSQRGSNTTECNFNSLNVNFTQMCKKCFHVIRWNLKGEEKVNSNLISISFAETLICIVIRGKSSCWFSLPSAHSEWEKSFFQWKRFFIILRELPTMLLAANQRTCHDD